MLSVGPWVLETACRQARDWQRRGSRGLRVMVNLSAHELQQGELVVHVEKALAASGLDPDALHLEIPEGYAMQDLDRTVETLRALRSVGVHLSIDGFGAGFSSLAHLRRLPVDALKIDLSFVRGATTDPDDASIVTAVIAVAHSLGLRVVALGVETEAQVALLRSLGCDEVQGYLWSPPVPPEKCERMLAEGVLPASSFPPRSRRGRPGRPARGAAGAPAIAAHSGDGSIIAACARALPPRRGPRRPGDPGGPALGRRPAGARGHPRGRPPRRGRVVARRGGAGFRQREPKEGAGDRGDRGPRPLRRPDALRRRAGPRPGAPEGDRAGPAARPHAPGRDRQHGAVGRATTASPSSSTPSTTTATPSSSPRTRTAPSSRPS